MFKFLKKIIKKLFKKEEPESLFLKILEEERTIIIKKGLGND